MTSQSASSLLRFWLLYALQLHGSYNMTHNSRYNWQLSIFIDIILFINKSGATSVHWLYIMPFDRLLAALVLIKYKAIFVAILLSNYQKSCYICLSSAIVSQSLNICTCHVYRYLSKASVRHSRFWPRFTTFHPDSSKAVKSTFIGIEIQHQ